VPNRLEQALDLSKNVLDQAKRDLGNSLYILDKQRREEKVAFWGRLLFYSFLSMGIGGLQRTNTVAAGKRLRFIFGQHPVVLTQEANVGIHARPI
jgi:hypothetical protein